MTFESANADDPNVIIKNTTNDNQAARLTFMKDRGAAMVDSDRIAEIDFVGEDASQNSQGYGKIMCQALESDHGSETGMLKLQVAEYDGSLGVGFKLAGTNADGIIDATIGLGTTSETTVTGTLTMGSTATLTNAGLVAVANQSNITGLGTISSGVWNGTKITDVYTNSSGRRYGSTIKILPSDFMINEDAASPLSFKDGSNSGVHVNDADNEVLAFITIPEGMKATHVDVYATHNKTLKVWEVDLNDTFNFTTVATKGTGACNTQLDITDVDATATNYLAIQVAVSATSNRIWGGLVTIAPQ